MAFLEQFNEEQRDMIVSLPYRAGLWLSASDDCGGTEADYEELSALEDIIENKAAMDHPSALVSEVMNDAMRDQSRWKKWAKDLDTVERDCATVNAILLEKLSEQDVEHYRQAVITITSEVAKAYREIDQDASFWVKVIVRARLCFDAVRKAFGQGPEIERYLNISYSEEVAMSRLAAALRGQGLGAGPEEKNV